MKQILKILSLLIFAAFILPVCVYLIIHFTETPKENNKKETTDSKETISVYFHEEDKVRTMALDEYLKGVVCGEVPASFEEEAIKAQAVAARSYALYRAQSTNPQHPNASVCTDYKHCKAYKHKEKARADWGENADKYEKKIAKCVDATKGEVIKYDGEIALAVFHSQSGGGRTENAQDVWGGNLPYLVSVESHGEEDAPNFFSSASFTFEEFKKVIENDNPDAKINSFKDITNIINSDGGGIKKLTIGGVEFKGSKIRTLFNLRSTCFTMREENGNIIFEVTGYGHGVGMSQYGANAMAKDGYTYKEILTHYYSGTKIDYV